LNFFLGQIFYDEIPQDYIEYAYLTGHQIGGHHAPLYFVGGQLFSPDIRERFYEELTMPVLVIWGDDPNVSYENLPTTVDERENWTAVRFDQSRSLPHWDEFDRTIGLLDELHATVD
ncbi:MAG: alpha/beta hydrolase, partial [Chloroflexota bacterium]